MNSLFTSDDLPSQACCEGPSKKVALFTDVDFWAGGAGHRMRIAALVSYLSERVELTVIYTGDASRPAVVGSFVFILANTGNSDEVVEMFQEMPPHRPFDTAIIEYVHNSYWLDYLPDGMTCILDAHDIISERAESCAAFDYAGALYEIPSDLEYELFDQYDHVMVLTIQDARKIGAVLGNEKAILCPHPAAHRRHGIRKQVKHLGFVASEYLPNYDALCFFLKECWPSLYKNYDISLLVYGNVRKWFRNEPPREKVDFKGFVPDLDEVYDELDIVINPVRFGAGLKIKNIEAMANGLPLVTTTHGAAGLESAVGKAILVADSAKDFILQLQLLIEDCSVREEMGCNGYLLACDLFSPEACFEPLLKVI